MLPSHKLIIHALKIHRNWSEVGGNHRAPPCSQRPTTFAVHQSITPANAKLECPLHSHNILVLIH